tara:strand:+ start:784 stop:954 length:171 start_codon:yes stop_codon:yes gene_type:complete
MKKKFYTKKQRLTYGIGWFLISIAAAGLFEYIGWTILTYISVGFGLLSLYAIKERN